MTLEDALRYEGYTIDVAEVDAFDIAVASGTISVPAMAASKLTWARDEPPVLGDDLYLSNLPIFADEYRPVILSHILDRFRTRRLGYNTPGEWRLAFRRWGNLNMTIPNRRYVSTGVALPLDDRDETDATDRTLAATSHGLDIGSDFPQSLVSGDSDYATNATDRRTADNTESGETTRRTGRSQSTMRLLDEQRAAYLNVDAEILDGLETLFLGLFDQGEGNPRAQYGIAASGVPRLNW
jgi:hypothetical protein